MAEGVWLQLCGDKSFKILDKGCLSGCFEELCLHAPSSLLLMLISCYWVGEASVLVEQSIYTPKVWNARMYILVLLLLQDVTWIVTKSALGYHVTMAVILATIIACLAIVAHMCYVYKVRNSQFRSKEPRAIMVVWFVMIVYSVVSLTSFLLEYIDLKRNGKIELSHNLDIANVSFRAVFEIVYLYLCEKSKVVYESLRDEPQDSSYEPLNIDSSLGVASDNAGLLSRLAFHWVWPLIQKGVDSTLDTPFDVFELPPHLTPANVSSKVKHELVREKEKIERKARERRFQVDGYGDRQEENDRKGIPYSLVGVLHRCFSRSFYFSGFLKFIGDCIGFTSPILLNLLVSFVETSEFSSYGFYLAAGLFASALLNGLIDSHFRYVVAGVEYTIRAAISTMVYNKLLSVNTPNLHTRSSGEILNLMSTDTDRIANFAVSFHTFWSLPFQVLVTLYLLYTQVGLAFLATVAAALLLVPLNKFVAKKIGVLSEKMMTEKDSRVNIMGEILTGIRHIKLYVWEQIFKEKVLGIRSREIKHLKGRKYLDAICVYFWVVTPVIIAMATFITYVLLGNRLTAAKVFTSLALFNILIGPLNAFPWVINGLVESWISLRRVQSFMQIPDADWEEYFNDEKDDESNHVRIEDGAFSFKEESFGLSDLDLNIKKGDLVMIVGPVGSGKTALLLSILGEMNKSKGNVFSLSHSKGTGFVSQDPWLQRSSIKTNIIMGSLVNDQKYHRVLASCSLLEDLRSMMDGDGTDVGEGGCALSGGQRARVCLARAAYKDFDMYLLDNVLASVDGPVGDEIFSKCILGVMGSKTRVLVTHHKKHLRYADHIITMKDGKISGTGSPNQILEKLLSQDDIFHEEDDKDDVEESKDRREEAVVQAEEREEGVVSLSVYQSYWSAIGTGLSVVILLSLLFMQISKNLSDWWLAHWISEDRDANRTDMLWEIQEMPKDVEWYLIIYGCLGLINSGFTLVRAFLFAYGGIVAAVKIHENLIEKLLEGCIRFFDITPVGRILNRFSSDIYSVDDSLPFILNIFLAQVYILMGVLVIVTIGLPWMALLYIPLACLLWYLAKIYRPASRELKRLDTLSRSPVYAHFSETLSGRIIIRAFNSGQQFEYMNEVNLDARLRVSFSTLVASLWWSVRLQLVGAMIIGAVALISVLNHMFGVANPALIGLAVAYSLTLTNVLTSLISTFTETERELVCLERVQQYINGGIPSEPYVGSLVPPPTWPQHGEVVLRSVVLQYPGSETNALDEFSIEIQPGQKVAIVGRTGAGKSSILSLLFRLVDPTSGHILIDGMDIRLLGLKDLRSRMAIIPQVPFLFSGSMRFNLDPTNRYTDGDIWTALEYCTLKRKVIDMGGLEMELSEGGRELSTGERQLLCLSRALLHRCKIICIDEATANVDAETDDRISRITRNTFRGATVITIAHRINTIIEYDRVIVMARGKILEDDVPFNLLDDQRSYFYSLANSC